MNILITGAAGFVGKNLTAALECIRDGRTNSFYSVDLQFVDSENVSGFMRRGR